MPPEFDDHILSTMTDEERATILEAPNADEIAAIAAIANGDEDGPDDEDDDVEEVADAAAPVATVATVAKESAPDPATAPADTAPADTFQPTYQAKLPDDFAAQELGLKGQSDALAARFKAGEIDFDQYRVEFETLSKSERALDEIRLKASLSQEMSEQTAEQQWNHTVQKFISATAKDGGIDYTKDPAKHADFDLFVRTLAKNDANADKSAEWFLVEANKRVCALHGIGLAVAPPITDKGNSRKTPISAAPKTLAQVPGSDGPGDVDGNEFSDVDRLTGDAQEAAIAKMSSAQRERYMAGV